MTKKIEKKRNRLEILIAIIPDLLINLKEDEFSRKPRPDKWSKKEILGHLIDSATNNHHRFVRGQFEYIPLVTYKPDEWAQYNFYNLIDKEQLIKFWTIYNKQILALIRLIPEEHLDKKCDVGSDEKQTLHFLFNDYVEHLEHHLKQIVDYKI